MLSLILGARLSDNNPARWFMTTYLHGAGIESGYRFFAPNVPNSYKLVFQIRYLDGHVEYQLPQVAGHAAGLRLVGLLDNVGNMRYELLRRTVLKMLAFSVWREHPEATTIRAVLGSVKLPPIAKSSQGEREIYEVLCAYDFTFPAAPDSTK